VTSTTPHPSEQPLHPAPSAPARGRWPFRGVVVMVARPRDPSHLDSDAGPTAWIRTRLPSAMRLRLRLRGRRGVPDMELEPTTFRIRVAAHPSSVCQPGRFWLLTSAESSVECGPDRWRYDRENDQPTHGRTTRPADPPIAIGR
jgi:hypothetical protein